MAQPVFCSQHSDREAVVILSFLDPTLDEPTQALCDECTPAMAATILQSYVPDRDVMAFLFPPVTEEEVAEADQATVQPRKRASRAKKATASRNGHSPAESSVEAVAPDSDETTNDETTPTTVDAQF